MRNHDDDHDYVKTGPFNECGIDLPELNTERPELNTERHTAISCAHQTDAIRARMRKALEESSLLALLSLRYPHQSELNDILDFITSVATAEANTLMWEHSAETAAEYRQILKEATK